MASWSVSDRLIDNDPINGHVTRDRFGTDIDIPETFLRYVDNLPKRPEGYHGFDIPYLLRDFYCKTFKLTDSTYTDDYKHVDFTGGLQPLAMVSMNAKEGLLESNAYRNRFKQYRAYKVYEATGIPFDKWMDKPTHEIEMLLDDLRSDYKLSEEKKEAERRTHENMAAQRGIPMSRHTGQLSDEITEQLMNGSKALK